MNMTSLENYVMRTAERINKNLDNIYTVLIFCSKKINYLYKLIFHQIQMLNGKNIVYYLIYRLKVTKKII